MKVTVIATGFNVENGDHFMTPRPVTQRTMENDEPIIDEVTEPPAGTEEDSEEIPFYRKVIAQSQNDDPNGYGPNWSNVDDFDIPTVLRKQMD